MAHDVKSQLKSISDNLSCSPLRRKVINAVVCGHRQADLSKRDAEDALRWAEADQAALKWFFEYGKDPIDSKSYRYMVLIIADALKIHEDICRKD